MRTTRTLLALAGITTMTLGAAACSDETKDDIEDAARSVASDVQEGASDALDSAVETAVRNFAKEQGEEQFRDAGVELDTDLTCTAAVADGISKVDIDCTGTTTDGKSAELTGQTDEIPGASINQLAGSFSGTVDGAEVFSTETLGG